MSTATRRHTRGREPLRHVETTLPDETWAKRIAKTVLAERLAACVNWWQIRSQYWWKGEIELAGEFLVVFKTTLGHVEELQRRLHELHPYEVPYVAVSLASAVSPPYADWAAKEIGSDTQTGRRAPVVSTRARNR